MSYSWLQRLDYIRLGCESIFSVSVEVQTTGTRVNSFSFGRRTGVWESSQLRLESIVSELVKGQTSGTQVNSFRVGRRADVWDVTGVLGIFCEKKIHVSQLWDCGN